MITGLLTFLPGISERPKFTNALVAHTHLAITGLVTCLPVAILLIFGPGRAPRRWTFWVWLLGCAGQVAVLPWLGWREGADPAVLWARWSRRPVLRVAFGRGGGDVRGLVRMALRPGPEN